ncbi:hypothetical protein PIB30_101929, partial [Stylosanthes scabra]|nr:hypothetical protein [Stylosanthes scabra]
VMFGLGASQAPNVTNNTKGASSLAFSPSRLEHQNVTTMTPKANLKSRLALPNVSLSTPKCEPLAPPNVTSSMPSKSRLAPFSHTKRELPKIPKRDLPPMSCLASKRDHPCCPNVTTRQAKHDHAKL